MSTTKAEKYGIKPSVSLEDGVAIVTEWFKENKNTLDQRYNVFVNH
jgi:nucleoside-diphosphate-sugar epimerase